MKFSKNLEEGMNSGTRKNREESKTIVKCPRGTESQTLS